MFGLVDWGTYDIRIFFVNDNRHKETLLPIMKKNVFTNPGILHNNMGENSDYPSTRIYSDCFSTYQVSDFNRMGYILYKKSHSICFGAASFHTNSVEGVWSKIKRVTENLNGMNGSIFKKFDNNNFESTSYYINGWIYKGLFFVKCEHLNFGDHAKIELLKKYLKI